MPSSGTRAGPRLAPVPKVRGSISGCCRASSGRRTILLENTLRFARGLPANNAMLWGARGMGKSSLVKAVARRGATPKCPAAWR